MHNLDFKEWIAVLEVLLANILGPVYNYRHKRGRTFKDWATKALRPSVQGNRSSELVFEVKTLFTAASRRASSESIYMQMLLLPLSFSLSLLGACAV